MLLEGNSLNMQKNDRLNAALLQHRSNHLLTAAIHMLRVIAYFEAVVMSLSPAATYYEVNSSQCLLGWLPDVCVLDKGGRALNELVCVGLAITFE